jgi:uncharacterized protein YvpB
MTAFQAVDKGSIPLSRTIMRTRNLFFLVSVIVIISVSLFFRAKLSYTEKTGVLNSKVDLNVSTTTLPSATTSQSISKTKLTDVSKKDDSVVKTFKLDVPYFHQQYANSCEAASLRMALAYYDIKISDDMDIVQKFGYKPRDKNTVLDEWDNPQEMFVGNIDIVGSTKGYGVYGKPVVKAAKVYGRDASYETNITAQFLSSEIKAGHPIIFWGYTSITAPAYTWKLAGGGEVKAFKGEHARVLIGFTGDVDNPTGFYVHDPFNGKKSEYWTAEKLMKHVYAVPGVTNQIVIVK